MSVRILKSVLDEARGFFEDRGTLGCEGTAMVMADEHDVAGRLVIPEQTAHPVPHCWVEVTRAGKSELARALGPRDRYVARIHSHPGNAFHSKTDDENPALTHEGAISIVVPYFGLGLRHGLASCEVYVRSAGMWVGVSPGPQREAVISVS